MTNRTGAVGEAEIVGSSPRAGNRWAGMTNERPGPGGAWRKREESVIGIR